jgi:hypothetical protein
VSIHRSEQTILAGIFGMKTINVPVSATAGVGSSLTRKPVRMIIVHDASGSFREEWSQAVQATKDLANAVNGQSVDKDAIGVIAFNDDIKRTTYPSNPDRSSGRLRRVDDWGITVRNHGTKGLNVRSDIADFDPTNRTVLPTTLAKGISILEHDNPGGNTNPQPAIDWATSQLDHADGFDHVIILISDGMPNPSNRRQPTVDAVDRAAAKGIKIHTITLTNESSMSYGTEGSDYAFNSGLVRNGGKAFQTSDPAELSKLLSDAAIPEFTKPSLWK